MTQYLQRVMDIPKLSRLGAQQLSTDIGTQSTLGRDNAIPCLCRLRLRVVFAKCAICLGSTARPRIDARSQASRRIGRSVRISLLPCLPANPSSTEHLVVVAAVFCHSFRSVPNTSTEEQKIAALVAAMRGFKVNEGEA